MVPSENDQRIVGYCLQDPTIREDPIDGHKMAYIPIRTIRRNNLDAYQGSMYQDVVLFYDGNEYMNILERTEKFDMLDVTGVFNMVSMDKPSVCPECGMENVKENGSVPFIYPQFLQKINSLKGAFEYDKKKPDEMLIKFAEVSNRAILMGVAAKDPEVVVRTRKGVETVVCRFPLHIDRKFYIGTQSDTRSDYPYIYVYGQDAEATAKRVHGPSSDGPGTLVKIKGFLQTRRVQSTMRCQNCGHAYMYNDSAAEYVAYDIDFLNNERPEDSSELIEKAKHVRAQTALENRVFDS